jgi:hypothetical protein
VVETVVADRAEVPDTVRPPVSAVVPVILAPAVVLILPVILTGLLISRVVAAPTAVDVVTVTALDPEVLITRPEDEVLIEPADPAFREVKNPVRVVAPATESVEVRDAAPIETAPVVLLIVIPVPSAPRIAFNSEVETPSLIDRWFEEAMVLKE